MRVVLTREKVRAVVNECKLGRDELWERIEDICELEYEEFEAMWKERPQRVVKQ